MRTLWDYIIMIIGIVGSIASTVALYAFFQGLTAEGWIGVLFLGVISVYFIGYNLWLLNIYRRKTRYAYAYSEINIGFSYLHKLRRRENLTIDDILPAMEKLCDATSNAFGRIYGTQIGVCVKFIVDDNKRPRVETLVRDSHSRTSNRPTGTSDPIKHWIDMNSDFEFIYMNFDDANFDTSYYLERHLPTCRDYKNTRLGNNWKPNRGWYLSEYWYRKKNWPLKYMSALVVPIVPLLADEQKQSSIRGFLCIDSPHEGQFNSSFDVEILKGISDGLYNQIDLIYKLNKTE